MKYKYIIVYSFFSVIHKVTLFGNAELTLDREIEDATDVNTLLKELADKEGVKKLAAINIMKFPI